MILQEEAPYDILSAFSDNPVGGVMFVFLMGLVGMFALYILMPSLRNKTIMSAMLFILLGVCAVASLLVFPQFWEAIMEDPLMALVTAFGSIIGGAFIIPLIVVMVILLALGLVRGRGLVGG